MDPNLSSAVMSPEQQTYFSSLQQGVNPLTGSKSLQDGGDDPYSSGI